MSPEEQEELAEVLSELIKQHPKVVSAIWECTCRCPNLTVAH